jgi:O-antigen/teichoic acid export membrane protein
MAHYGARYYFGQLSNNVNVQIGTIILAVFAKKEEIGMFDVASQFATKAMVIPDSIVTVLLPKLASHKERKKELIAQCARLTLLSMCFLFLVLSLFMNQIVKILFSPAFLPVVSLFSILFFGVIIRSACKVFVPYLLGINRPGIVSLSSAIGAITNLIALWVLLPILGLNGAAISMVMGWSIGSVILFYSFRYNSKLSFANIWVPKKTDLNLFKPIILKLGLKRSSI